MAALCLLLLFLVPYLAVALDDPSSDADFKGGTNHMMLTSLEAIFLGRTSMGDGANWESSKDVDDGVDDEHIMKIVTTSGPVRGDGVTTKTNSTAVVAMHDARPPLESFISDDRFNGSLGNTSSSESNETFEGVENSTSKEVVLELQNGTSEDMTKKNPGVLDDSVFGDDSSDEGDHGLKDGGVWTVELELADAKKAWAGSGTRLKFGDQDNSLVGARAEGFKTAAKIPRRAEDGNVSLVTLDRVMAMWDPDLLVGSWEDVQMVEASGGISSECTRDLQHLLEATARSESWAVRMLDASGRYGRRLHSGNSFWMGSKDTCREVDVATNEMAMGSAPFGTKFHVATLYINISAPGLAGAHTIHLGVCVPETCSSKDMGNLLPALGTSFPRTVSVIQVRPIAGKYSLWTDLRFYAMLFASMVLVLLVLIGTAYDMRLEQQRSATDQENQPKDKLDRDAMNNNNNGDNNKEINVFGIKVDRDVLNNNTNNNKSRKMDNLGIKINGDMMKNNNDSNGKEMDISGIKLDIISINGPMECNGNQVTPEQVTPTKQWQWREDIDASISMQILLSFSLRTNLSKICSLSVGDDTLAPIHGLRLFSLVWVVLVHTCLILFQNADNKVIRAQAESDFLYQTLSSGTYSVDTFFLISGMLVSFLYFRTVSKLSMKELTYTTGLKARGLQFIGMMVYRFARLTPPYLFVLGVVELSMKWFHDNAVMELPSLDYFTCERYWWRNMIYLNTFFSTKERCMSWSWYLANDTQFYTVGIILLILAVNYFRIAVVATVVFLVSAWGTTAYITINTHHRPSIQDPFANYDDLYDKPWTRIGPYLIGMATGWLLFKKNCTISMHKAVVAIGWCASLVCMTSIVYGLYLVELGPIMSAAHVSLSHSAWALCVAWVVVACCTGYGGYVNNLLSCRYLYPLSRLTYCAYLIHPQLMRIILLIYDNPIHLTNEIVALLFVSYLIASYVVAFLISITFEAPVVSLLRIIHPLRRKKSS